MLMTLLGAAAMSMVLLVFLIQEARNAAEVRRGRKRATLIRMRLQEESRESRGYREIPIQLGQN
jgi:hypothetical protein